MVSKNVSGHDISSNALLCYANSLKTHANISNGFKCSFHLSIELNSIDSIRHAIYHLNRVSRGTCASNMLHNPQIKSIELLK